MIWALVLVPAGLVVLLAIHLFVPTAGRHERCLRNIDRLERELGLSLEPDTRPGNHMAGYETFLYELQGKIVEVYPGEPAPYFLPPSIDPIGAAINATGLTSSGVAATLIANEP